LAKLSKKKILVLGTGGMLGFTLYRYLNTFDNNLVYGTIRNQIDFFNNNSKIFSGYDATNTSIFLKLIKKIKPHFVINCIGIIKQRDEGNDIKGMMLINSIFPKKISYFCSQYNIKFIQISTDCVYDGLVGSYTESDQMNAYDIYGISKYLGEVYDGNHLTIRTSIIGHELRNKKSLLEWVISKNKNKIYGFKNAIFSGLTTLELSKIIHKYLLNYKVKGLYHIASDPINKHDLIQILIDQYNLDIKLLKNKSFKINRSLNDKKFTKISGYRHKKWGMMIKELRENFLLNKYN
jgi:dTDP-4-dehydrorhamnose reductase